MRLTEDTFLSRQTGPDYPSPTNHRQRSQSQAQTKEQYLYQLGHQGKKKIILTHLTCIALILKWIL